MIEQYAETLGELIASLDQENHALACRIAELPDEIRGYGHVKERNIATVRTRQQRLLANFREPASAASAAE